MSVAECKLQGKNEEAYNVNHVHQVNQLCLRHVIEAHVHHGTQQPRLFRDE